MQRLFRLTMRNGLIVAVAITLMCAADASADSWLPWRKTQEAATEKLPTAPNRAAIRSEATTPTMGNRKQIAPMNPVSVPKDESDRWWKRIGHRPVKSEKQTVAKKAKSSNDELPIVVKKGKAPLPEKIGLKQNFSTRNASSAVRIVAFDDEDGAENDIVAPAAPDLRKTPLAPELRQDPVKGQGLLPFEKTEGSPKIQLRSSAESDELISLTVRDAPLSVVLSLIAEQHGLNLVAGSDVEGRVTVTLNDVALDDALNALLTVNGYSWNRTRNILVVSKIAHESRSSPQLRGLVLRVFRLNYVAADDIEKVVLTLLSPAGVAVTTMVDAKNNRRTREEIVVEDLPEFVARVEAYISDVDRPPRQVLIEAHVLQVNLKGDCRAGVNIQEIANLGNTKVTLQTTGMANPKASPAFFFGIDNNNFHSLVEALSTLTDSKTLADTQVLCLNGQHAKIQIGQQLGFLVTTTTQTSTLQNVNFLDVGVVLDVTPIITDEGLVIMQVKPEVSGGQINPNGLPQEDTTEVETTVMLADDHGMIIGGLIKEEDTEVQTKIPYLGDLWVVGRLFQRRTVLRQRNEVIIALIPHIVPHPDDRPEGMDVGLERAGSRLLGPPLERMDRRQWEPDPPDAILNPKHLFSGELRRRVEDPYAASRQADLFKD